MGFAEVAVDAFPREMKTIRTYINAAEAGFASSLLESAGIQTLLKGEESFMLTPGLVSGGIQLQVDEEEAERAVRLLDQGFDAAADAPNASVGSTDDIPVQSEGRGRIPVGLFAAVAAALALMVFTVHQWAERSGQTNLDNYRHTLDYDKDGRPDHIYIYEMGMLRRGEVDRNGDGRMDAWMTYDEEGRELRDESDQNFDGRPDAWWFYREGEAVASEHDTDFDGRPDWFGTFEHGLMVRQDCRPGDSDIVVRRYLLTHEIYREEQVDEDRDGKFDYRILYDPFGTPSERKPVDQ